MIEFSKKNFAFINGRRGICCSHFFLVSIPIWCSVSFFIIILFIHNNNIHILWFFCPELFRHVYSICRFIYFFSNKPYGYDENNNNNNDKKQNRKFQINCQKKRIRWFIILCLQLIWIDWFNQIFVCCKKMFIMSKVFILISYHLFFFQYPEDIVNMNMLFAYVYVNNNLSKKKKFFRKKASNRKNNLD